MPKQSDYAKYSRTQIRDAFRRLRINQNAPTNKHLYQRAQDWDETQATDSVNSYILSKTEAENNVANLQHKKKPKGGRSPRKCAAKTSKLQLPQKTTKA